MSKIEICPNCSKEFNLSREMYKKNPFTDLFNPTQWWSQAEKKIMEIDLIECPHCHKTCKSTNAKFFGFMQPKHMRLLILTIIGGVIIFTIIDFLLNMGIIK